MPDKKTLEELRCSAEKLESIKRGDYIRQIRYEDIKDSPIGRIGCELEKLSQDFEKYRANQTAYQAAQEHSHKLAEKRQFWFGVLAGTIGSTIAGLIVLAVQNWNDVSAFFTSLFQ